MESHGERVGRTTHGDRRQELVYIGQNLPKEEMLLSLNACPF